jgi:hypothetical protein
LASVSEFGDILVYKYGVRNISTSTGTISGLDIDISRAPGTVEISAAGLTQGTGSLVGVGYPSLVRVGAAGIEVVPVGLSGATGWMSGLSVSGNAYWTATDDQYEILPGTIQQNFEITSRGLPAIRDFTVEPYLDLDRLPPLDVSDEDSGGWNVQNLGILKRLIKFSGRTIAPTAPPADFHPTAFLSTIHSYKDEAVRLGWMTDPQLSSRLDSSFENAGQFLKAGATESARQVLLALLTELTRSRGKVSSECMALLEVNTRYLLSNLGR